MTKKVTVALHGLQKRGVQVDLDATEGAVIGKNLRWPDGSVVSPQQVINRVTVVSTPTGVGAASTLWELILNLPKFIDSLAKLATEGLVIRTNTGGGTALTRSIGGELGRINVTDGDGLAGNPLITLGSWPTVKNSVAVGDDVTIPAGHQMLVWGVFTFDGGSLTMDGDLVVI